MKLLVDTSALMALVIEDDRRHEAAAAFVWAHPEARFVLTELILAEGATRLRARAGAARAVAVARELLRSKRYEMVFTDSALLDAALARMERLDDQRLSLADCASMEIMERLRLRPAFAFDDDVTHCGFEVVPA